MKIEDIKVGKMYRDEDDLVVVLAVDTVKEIVTVYDYGCEAEYQWVALWGDFVEVSQVEALDKLNPIPEPKVEIQQLMLKYKIVNNTLVLI